jgi:hypothetical protein
MMFYPQIADFRRFSLEDFIYVHPQSADISEATILLTFSRAMLIFIAHLSGGVMVAQGPLEAFVMVRIH